MRTSSESEKERGSQKSQTDETHQPTTLSVKTTAAAIVTVNSNNHVNKASSWQ